MYTLQGRNKKKVGLCVLYTNMKSILRKKISREIIKFSNEKWKERMQNFVNQQPRRAASGTPAGG